MLQRIFLFYLFNYYLYLHGFFTFIGASKKKSSKSKDTTTATTASVPRTGQLVGYQIRFDSSTVGADTKIKFMTDGILLKEVAQDLLLRKYRVVILDEAHERNINTDVLLGR